MKKWFIIYIFIIIFGVGLVFLAKKENLTGIHKRLDDLGFVSYEKNIYKLYDKDSTTEINLLTNMCINVNTKDDNSLYVFYNFYTNETNVINIVYSYNETERVFAINTYDDKSEDLIMNKIIQKTVSNCKDYIGDYKFAEQEKNNYNEIKFDDFRKKHLTKFNNYDDIIGGNIIGFSFDEENLNSKGDVLYLLNDENKIFGIDLTDDSYKSKRIMGSKANYVNNSNLIYDDYYIPIKFGYYTVNEIKYGGTCLDCDKELLIDLGDKKKYSTNCINMDDINYSYINEQWFQMKVNDSLFLVDSDSGIITKLMFSNDENIVSINNDIIKTNYAYYDITGKKLDNLTMFYDEILDIASYDETLFLLASDNIIYKYSD